MYETNNEHLSHKCFRFQISWKKYFTLFFESVPNFSVDDNFKVLIRDRNALKKAFKEIYKPNGITNGTEILGKYIILLGFKKINNMAYIFYEGQ